MSKILEENGYKYSREEFEGYTHRAKFSFDVEGEDYESNIDIYTDSSDKDEVFNVIFNRKRDNVIFMDIINWATKEQDELTAKFIEETIKKLEE